MSKRSKPQFKILPEDFRVEELSDFSLCGGEFALYRLSKRCMGTLEALRTVGRAWQVARRAVSFGGMKDFQAVTRQHVTIERGPKRGFRDERFQLEYLGQAERPFTSKDIRANEFDVVLRDMSKQQIGELSPGIAAAAEGVPNYFDDQRFGSVGSSRKFMARHWCLGDFERALWLALADANEHDAPRDRREKEMLRQEWGAWPQCLPRIADPARRRVVGVLAERPLDFSAAIAKLPRDERRMQIAAFQSQLWNRLLTALLAQTCRAEQLISLPHCLGPLLSFRELDVEQRELLGRTELPLPSAREEPADERLRGLLDVVLAGEGLERKLLHIDHPRDTFFSRGGRAALATPQFSGSEEAADELHGGQRKLRLKFTLPRGAYGTMVLKQIVAK